MGAHCEGTRGLEQEQLEDASGDWRTTVHEGCGRPAMWLLENATAEQVSDYSVAWLGRRRKILAKLQNERDERDDDTPFDQASLSRSCSSAPSRRLDVPRWTDLSERHHTSRRNSKTGAAQPRLH